jgi:hypothetical protein
VLATGLVVASRTLPCDTTRPAAESVGTAMLPSPVLVIVWPPAAMPPEKSIAAEPPATVIRTASASASGAATVWVPLATVSVANPDRASRVSGPVPVSR